MVLKSLFQVASELLDLPTVRFGLRWARSSLVAGHLAGTPFGVSLADP
jgi:hypothetical protein